LFGISTALGLLRLACEDRPGLERTDAFIVADGAFTTPRSGTLVITGLAHLALIAACFTVGVNESDVLAPWLTLLIAIAAPLAYYG
jgi:hypothetical protein